MTLDVVARINVGVEPNGISFSTIVPSGRYPSMMGLPLQHGHGSTHETEMPHEHS